MFLITGSGRSGTQYIARALCACGLNVGHEARGRDGIVSGFYAFKARHYPGKHPNPRPHFDIILHQVRHPLRAIASIQTGKSWTWARQFAPFQPRASLLNRACHVWLAFNEQAERISEWTYQIEALPDVWPEFTARLGFNAPYSAIAGIPRNTNARRHAAITWGDVERAAPEIAANITAAARRYGYE